MNAGLSILLCFVVFALGGCSGHTHSLVYEDDRQLTFGEFQHEGPDESSMVMEYRGARFEARGFAIMRTQNVEELRRIHGPGKHYDRIFSGLDTDHYLYSAQPVLRANNGEILQCVAGWRAGGPPMGNCVTADGARINFRFD
jgi:hypothetical protein